MPKAIKYKARRYALRERHSFYVLLGVTYMDYLYLPVLIAWRTDPRDARKCNNAVEIEN